GLGLGTVKALGIGAAAAVGITPALMAAAGAAAGAGIYLGVRAMVEHWRGIVRREEQGAVGQGPEEFSKLDATIAASQIHTLTEELATSGILNSEQLDTIANSIANLEVQDEQKKNRLKVNSDEGAAF